MNKVYNSQQLNKKSGACQKLTELTGFTHMKHILITDTKYLGYLKCTAVWWSHCYCHGSYKGQRKMQKDILIYRLPQLIDDFHGSDLQTSHHALSST